MVIKLSNSTIDIGNKRLFNNLTISIYKGFIYRLTGPNGIGKSIFLKTLLGLHKMTEGSLEVTIPNSKTVYISDTYFFSDDESIRFVIKLLKSFYNVENDTILSIFRHLELDYDEISKQYVYELSLGTRSKLAVVPLFFNDNNLFVMDEIFTGIDSRTQKRIIDQISMLQSMGKTIIFVEHNEIIATQFIDNPKFKEVKCINQTIV